MRGWESCAATIGAGPVITAATAGVGSTFTVRNFPFTSKANLIDAWFQAPHAGMLRVRSPKFADNVQGIRVNANGVLNGGLLTPSSPQFLIPQDSLTVELNGTAADVLEAIGDAYPDLAAECYRQADEASKAMMWKRFGQFYLGIPSPLSSQKSGI